MSLPNIHTSSKSDEWETPSDFYKLWDDVFKFNIDVCATNDNHLCNVYWTKEDNSLIQDWGENTCWMNPPYGRQISSFMEKAYNEYLNGSTVVCLIPSRTDTKWWHKYCIHGDVYFVKGRLKFINRTFPSWRPDGNCKISPAGFPSAVIVFSNKEYVISNELLNRCSKI